MQQNDPWATVGRPVAKPTPLPTAPQPFPGAITGVRRAPSLEEDDAFKRNRDLRDANQDARAATALQLQEQAAEIARLRADADERRRSMNSGVDTTVSEDQSGSHVVMLETSMKALDRIAKTNPRDLAPTWFEKGVSGVTGGDRDFVSMAQTQDRQIATAAYKNAIQSAIWISTGAAAPKEQVDEITLSVTPSIGDLNNPGTLAFKRQVLQGYIESARVRAGPANLKVQAALDRLEQSLPQIYGEPSSQQSPAATAPETELSGKEELIPIPAPMQAEYEAWLAKRPPGSLTVEEYLPFYEGLAKKYEFGLPQSSLETAKDWVKAYNEGKAGLAIPNPSRELEGFEKTLASAAADKGVVGDVYTIAANAANAASFGIPELVSGREGRGALDRLNEENPYAALTGEVLGSLAPGALTIKGSTRVLAPMVENQITRDVMADVAGNAAYGGIRGYTGAEPEDRTAATLTEAAIGGTSSLAARGLMRGARGFLSEGKTKALDALGEQTFAVPPQRAALPADEITPPAYQGMSDDQIRAEIARSQRGIDAWNATSRTAAENQAARQALEAEAVQTAKANVNRQEVFVRENFRSTNPSGIDTVRAEAARQFPTDPAEVMALPQFAERAKALKDFPTKGLEPREVLEARKARLTDYLGQDPTPSAGKIDAVDLTTAQRAGLTDAEEAITGLPGVHGAREKSIESFNRQNSARVLGRIGQSLPKDLPVGTEMNAYVNKQLNSAYNALRPSITGKVDRGFLNGIAALRKQGTATPERAALWQEVEDNLIRFAKPDGTFDGEGYKQLSTTLRRYSETWGSNANPATTVAMQDMARLAEQARKQAQALVARANPAVGRRLKTIEGAWAHQARIEAASIGPAKASGGVYAPDEYLNAIQRLDTSKGKTAVARGRGFDQEYGQAARSVIGGKPNKKTSIATTALTGYALKSLGPLGWATGLLTATSYTPGSKRLVQAIVDGKLGATPEAVQKALRDTELGRGLLRGTSAVARQRVLEQLLRASGSEAAQE